MKIKKLLIIFLLPIISACGQKERASKKKSLDPTFDPRARELNNSAVKMNMYGDDSLAISLLDQATAIDTNFFTAYENKFTFQYGSKKYDDAIQTGKKLLILRPNYVEFYGSLGTLYYLKGDSTSGDEYYNQALVRYTKILDTMNVNNKNYKATNIMRADVLIMLERYDEGNKILKELYDKETDEAYKNFMAPCMNKSRKEILENIGKPNGGNWTKIK